MITKRVLTLLSTVAALAITVSAAGNPLFAAEKEIVSYRLKQWKTVHFEDAKKAETHYQTIKKLGCATRKNAHGGHVDVMYRCPEWRQIALRTHDSAHQWERWLKASGFETVHSH